MNQQTQFKGGLKRLPRDGRDFKYSQVFGTVEKLPEDDFLVGEPLEIKDQFMSDLCAAFAGCSVSELQEGVKLSPEWQFSEIKRMEGRWNTWGSDLRTACKSFVKLGSLPKEDAPFNLENQDRNFVANWKNWDKAKDAYFFQAKAEKHKKQSYFRIEQENYQDLFDALRAALWQNREHRRAILTGCLWRDHWTTAENGIIPKKYEAGLFGHALCFIGQKQINGEIHLVAQLSNGQEIGDNGLFYFPRNVVNTEFRFGNFMFIDKNPEITKKEIWTLKQKIIDFLKKFCKS